MTAELLQQAAAVAERLADSLRRTVDDTSWVYGPRIDLADLEALLPALREALDTIKRDRSLEQISGAAGDAATHPWVVGEDGEIQCPACQTHPVGFLLADGRVPPCDATSACQHAVLADDDGGGRCIYCKTVYPATAVVEAVSS